LRLPSRGKELEVRSDAISAALLYKNLFFAEKLRNRERWIFAQLQIELRDVEPDQIDPVVNAVVVRIVFVEEGTVPFLEVVIEHQVQLQVQMRPLAIDSRSGVTHHRDLLPAMHRVSGSNVDFTEMPVETEIRRAAPAMFDHDVLPVV